MSEDLVNEIAALQSIYGPDVLREEDGAFVYVLSIPRREASLRVLLPPDYPKSIPQLLRVERTGAQARKGYGSYVLDTARATLLSVFISGSVCLFDLLQELDTALAEESEGQQPSLLHTGKDGSLLPNAAPSDACSLEEDPHWVLSSTVTKKKSTFAARACTVTSPAHAQACITRLLENDKHTARATHTISAHRVRTPSAAKMIGEVLYEDCDDDGEIAAGRRLLHLLQVMNVWNVLVIVSRWYGGVKLGPDRFNIINDVAREAVVKGGWTQSKRSSK